LNAKIITISMTIVLGLFVLSACTAGTTGQASATATPETKIANPATANCELKGFRSQIRTTVDGSQYGVCSFPDGSECEEWAFYRGECAPAPEKTTSGFDNSQIANPASAYCQEKGGKMEIRTAEDGSQNGICVFPDKSECEEWAFFKGECVSGSNNPFK
jgi:putative hemolysin